MNKVIIITGCTGVGKSALAVKLAKELNGEIISADSMQIYCGLNVGTAKIQTDEMDGVPHHMIDIVDPNTRFTVAEYSKLAIQIIDKIIEKGKVPIICGGTGLYINSIIFKLSFSDFDIELKQQVKELSQNLSKQELWNKLNAIDHKRASELSVNDTKRVCRALEIAISGKKPQNDETEILRYHPYIFILNGNRQEIYDRINKRVDIMVENGLVAEVKSLLEAGISRDSQAIQGIGYKEITAYLDGDCSLVDAIDLVKQKSRNYAKRQLTWFRRYYPNAIYLNYKTPQENIQIIKNIWQQ